MDISLVVPVYNEAESLPELIEWIEKVMVENNFSYEIIFIDDGSSDNSWNIIEASAIRNKNIRGIKFMRNYGKSAALQCGFKEAKGEVVITMDSDLQDNPEEIPELYKMIKVDDYDLVSGWKKIRHDPFFSKNLPSKFYNFTVRTLSGIKIHDFNCGLKAYKNRVVKCIDLYGEMHRYIPVLAKWAGFKKIGEKIVKHQERKYGKTKFGPQRFIRGPLDLLSVMFITQYGKRPMHLFGMLGSIMFFIGFFIAIYLGINKIIALKKHIPAPLIANNPFFYIALTVMILGTILFIGGFLGELIIRTDSSKDNYLIDKKI